MGDKNEVVLHTRVQALMETGETAGELAPRQPKLSFSPTNSKPMAGSKRQSQLHTLKRSSTSSAISEMRHCAQCTTIIRGNSWELMTS